MTSQPEVSIIIVNYRGVEYTTQCIRSILSTDVKLPYEVIVVDNHSEDGSVQVLRSQFPDIRVIEAEENRGFGAANNAGANIAEGDFLFFLNNDTKILDDCFTPLINFLREHRDCGIVAPKLIYPDGRFQLSYGRYPSLLNELRTKRLSREEENITPPDIPQKKEWVTGAALCLRKELFLSIGGFDETYFMYFEDADLCRRITQAGYTIYYIPTVSIIHFKGMSHTSKKNTIYLEYRRSQLRYYRKHSSFVQLIFLKAYLFTKIVGARSKRKEFIRMIVCE